MFNKLRQQINSDDDDDDDEDRGDQAAGSEGELSGAESAGSVRKSHKVFRVIKQQIRRHQKQQQQLDCIEASCAANDQISTLSSKPTSLNLDHRLINRAAPVSQQDPIGEPAEPARPLSIQSICGQLLALVCLLLLLLHLLNLISKLMTNFISKLLGGERRRSLAASSQQNLATASQQPEQVAAANTLTMPRNSISTGQNHRRLSRSSIHSVSAALLSALTGGSTANLNSQSSATSNGKVLLLLSNIVLA